MPVRVYKLAREFDLSIKEVLETCRRVGLAVRSHSSTLVEEEAEVVRRELSALSSRMPRHLRE